MCGCVGFVMCGCVGFVMGGFCNVWVCVCMGFVICRCFVKCVLVFTVLYYL
jgi:hypothetical protein